MSNSIPQFLVVEKMNKLMPKITPSECRCDDDLASVFLDIFCIWYTVENSPPPSWHPTPSPHTLDQTIWPHSLLKSLPFGHECFSEGCGLGASAEGSTPQGDLGLATSNGWGAQGCGTLPTRDWGVAHQNLALLPLDGRASQAEGCPALCEAGVTHGEGEPIRGRGGVAGDLLPQQPAWEMLSTLGLNLVSSPWGS